MVWSPGAGSKGGIPTTSVDEPRVRALMVQAAVGDDLAIAESPDEIRAEARAAVSRGDERIVAADATAQPASSRQSFSGRGRPSRFCRTEA